MRQYLLLNLVSLFMATTVFAQGKTKAIPTSVKQSFTQSHPSATKVKWEKENGDYEVNFIEKSKEMSAVYDEKGTLIETEIAIDIASLPAKASSYIREHYKNSIKDAARITKVNGEVFYEAEVNKTDVIFDSDGNFVRIEKD